MPSCSRSCKCCASSWVGAVGYCCCCHGCCQRPYDSAYADSCHRPFLGASTSTDDLTGPATIALAVVTFITLLATIYFATAKRRRARKERDDRQLAQARLVLTGTPGETKAAVKDGSDYRHELNFQFGNYGDRAIMDIQAEVWAGTAPLDQQFTSGMRDRVVRAGENKRYVVGVASPAGTLKLGAWRIRWTDADGQQWFVDQISQPEPLRFEGQPPRRY